MSSTPQVATQEISDTDLDNVSGGVGASISGSVSVASPVSASVGFGASVDAGLPDVGGLIPAL
jgi:hypothetical protein